MSCVINDVRAPSPVPEVAELSQICEGLARQRPDNIQTLLHAMALIAPLLNAIPNVVFFIKDVQARYLMVNMTLARRCGFKTVVSLLGKPLLMFSLQRLGWAIPSRICGCCAKG